MGILEPPESRLERLGQAFTREYEALLRFAYFLTAHRAAAEDLVQEAFLLIYRAGDRVDDGRLPAYARQTIVNLNRSAFRRMQLARRIERRERGPSGDPGERAADQDVRRALLGLPARTRACLVLRYYEDMKEQDIAETLGMSLAAVKKQMERGMKRLRATLGETESG